MSPLSFIKWNLEKITHCNSEAAGGGAGMRGEWAGGVGEFSIRGSVPSRTQQEFH